MRIRAIKAVVILILASVPLAGLPAAPAAAGSSYSWSISCHGDGSATSYFAWYDNGVLVGTGGSGCSGTNSFSGTGTIPAGANKVYAELDVTVFGNIAQDTTTQSFDPSSPKISISLHVSASTSGCSKQCGPKVSENADFTLKATARPLSAIDFGFRSDWKAPPSRRGTSDSSGAAQIAMIVAIWAEVGPDDPANPIDTKTHGEDGAREVEGSECASAQEKTVD